MQNVANVAKCCSLETVQDFLIKLGIKPLMYFSLNNAILRLIKIMNRADKNWAHNWVNKESTLKMKVFKNFH